MKISVITAVYNRQATIKHAVQSVQAQTHSPVEHIIQDGGSTDSTLAIIASVARPNTHLHSGPDTGIYDAINKGIARATGDIIGLMHSDDFFADDTVLAQVASAFTDPDIDGVYGDLDYVAATDIRRVVRHWHAGKMSRAALKRGWMPPHPTLYLRRAVFEKSGGYDTGFQIAADYDAMLRWLHIGQIKLAYIPQVMVKMRTGGESNRSLGRLVQKSREDYRALRSNDLGGITTLMHKNLRKVSQFIVRS